MKVIVTCGPSYEPLDEVRRLTNFSTGELGGLLSTALADAGLETICLRGAAATAPVSPGWFELRTFTTNDDLADQMQELAAKGDVTAVFHAAALCDYRVQGILDSSGSAVAEAKIPSRHGALQILLEPATKLISRLREWFPQSLLVGWKYELDGTAASAIGKARQQVRENETDACIVNGFAYGDGFGFVQATGCRDHLPDKKRLCAFLAKWAKEQALRANRSECPSTADTLSDAA